MSVRPTFTLCFLSGIAGLVYEVAWARQFGAVFGNTVQSAAVVTAVTMFGLGVGGYAAGKWADRRFSAGGPSRVGRAYGVAEIGAGVLGAVLALVFTHLGALSASVSSYARVDGWYVPSTMSSVARVAIAAVMLAPSSLLLGSTLPLLVRAVHVDRHATAGWTTGLVYGINTAGAALGAVATDLLLVPRLGLARTQLAAAALDIGVGVMALALFRRTATGDAPPATAEPDEALDGGPAAPAPPSRSLAAAAFALFASGLAALGLEIVWFRVLAGAFGSYRPVLSVLLASILSGLWVGSLVGARVAKKRAAPPAVLLTLSQAAVAVTSLLLLLAVHRGMFISPGAMPPQGLARLLTATGAIVALVVLPSLFMGFSFPFANAAAEHAFADVGARAGVLYLANTAGSVCGSLLAGFVTLPLLGSQASALAFAAVAFVGPLPLVALGRAGLSEKARRAIGVAAIATAPLLVAWLALPSTFLLRRWFAPLPDGVKVLVESEDVSEVVVVTEEADRRALYTNGHPMSGTSRFSQRYMRAFAHIPLLMQEAPKRALVICFGVGNTLHAVSLHRALERIEIADLSRNVLSQAHLFASTNHDVLLDPRVSVFVDDGRQHLRMSEPGSFDLVTLEPPPIAFAGVSGLYSKEFYEIARSRLRPGGMITQWLPAYQVPARTNLAMIRAFLDVFPSSTVLLSGERAELILLGTNGPAPVLDLGRVRARLATEPAVGADLASIRMGTFTELAGTFVSSGAHLARATDGVAPVTDDLPSMEYAILSGTPNEIPATIFDLEDSRSWCPSCWDGAQPSRRVPLFDRYMRVLGAFYATRAFLTSHYPVEIEDVDGTLGPAIEKSEYLRAILGDEQ